MNTYEKNNLSRKYYEYEGGYITYNPKNLTEKYVSAEMRERNSKIL